MCSGTILLALGIGTRGSTAVPSRQNHSVIPLTVRSSPAPLPSPHASSALSPSPPAAAPLTPPPRPALPRLPALRVRLQDWLSAAKPHLPPAAIGRFCPRGAAIGGRATALRVGPRRGRGAWPGRFCCWVGGERSGRGVRGPRTPGQAGSGAGRRGAGTADGGAGPSGSHERRRVRGR